ncbi:unnamed protein product [Durusdinium trenchii]|uniref:Ubiquitin-like domain-containing protein n=1 Tax=Durusdinium trenchii TaxID=1381693 RepID=A0ABP0K4J9_9DINO
MAKRTVYARREIATTLQAGIHQVPRLMWSSSILICAEGCKEVVVVNQQMNMKVKVTVDLGGLADHGSLNLVVGANDTVASLKERIASVSLVPFPDQVLSLERRPDTALPEEALLGSCGVQDGSSLVLSAAPSADALLHQFEDLLSSREMSLDELSLLYCYKHGISATQVLKALGLSGLEDLLGGSKRIALRNRRARLRASAEPQTRGEVQQVLGAQRSVASVINTDVVSFCDEWQTWQSFLAKPILCSKVCLVD